MSTEARTSEHHVDVEWQPLVEIDQMADGKIITRICHNEMDYRAFGLVIYDLVRHVARAYKVTDDQVWEWVIRERAHPTTNIEMPS